MEICIKIQSLEGGGMSELIGLFVRAEFIVYKNYYSILKRFHFGSAPIWNWFDLLCV